MVSAADVQVHNLSCGIFGVEFLTTVTGVGRQCRSHMLADIDTGGGHDGYREQRQRPQKDVFHKGHQRSCKVHVRWSKHLNPRLSIGGLSPC